MNTKAVGSHSPGAETNVGSGGVALESLALMEVEHAMLTSDQQNVLEILKQTLNLRVASGGGGG